MDKPAYHMSTMTATNDSGVYQASAMDMSSYKIDEGYSEETRSLDQDSPVGLGPNPEEMIPTSLRLAMDTIMSLSESEKSGMHGVVGI